MVGFDRLSKELQKFIVELDQLTQEAAELQLFGTMHALKDAKRKVGWEIAGAILAEREKDGC